MELILPQVSQPLRLWEKVEIVVGEDDQKGLYLARIEDFVDGEIVVSNPEFQEGSTLLRDYCEVMVLVTKEDAVYQFYSQIRKTSQDGRTLFVLNSPRYIRRVQRRQFVRVELFSKVRFSNLGASYKGDDLTWHDSTSVNISGGGMCIKSPHDLEPPHVLLLESEVFDKLDVAQPIAAICRRSFSSEKIHYSGVEFIRSDSLWHYFYPEELKKLPQSVNKFDHLVQGRLVTHIFQHQIEMRKKGLI